MQNFPIFLRLAGRRVILCGGGETALRKARRVLRSEAALTLIAEAPCAGLLALEAEGRLERLEDAPDAIFAGAALIIIATDDPARDAALAARARVSGAPVNVAGRADLSDALLPSLVDRDPVMIAIGTEGAAPALGRAVRDEIERMLSPRLGLLARLAAGLRGGVAANLPRAARGRIWARALRGEARAHAEAGRAVDAGRALRDAIAADAPGQGHVALVGAGPGARDLLTFRAARRIEQADVVLYDRLVDPEVVALAREDAEVIYVGKAVGANAWPQPKIDALIEEKARQGLRVVRLKSGDPSVFGRAVEELEAADRAGVPCEIIPGVTAASAAAASILQPLTARGETDTFLLSTGMPRPGDADPDRRGCARPGMSMAFYMAVEKAGRVQADLLAAGLPPEAPADIVSCAATERERHAACTLGALAQTIEAEGLPSPAILFVRWPKSMAARVEAAA